MKTIAELKETGFIVSEDETMVVRDWAMKTIDELGETGFILSEEEMMVVRDWARLASDTRVRLYPEEETLISEIESKTKPLESRAKPLVEVLGGTIVDELFLEGFMEGLI